MQSDMWTGMKEALPVEEGRLPAENRHSDTPEDEDEQAWMAGRHLLDGTVRARLRCAPHDRKPPMNEKSILL